MSEKDEMMIKLANEIDEWSIEDRVKLARFVLFNNVNINNVNELELDDSVDNDSATDMFLKGAVAMFDYAHGRAANHFHGSESLNKQCEIENEFLLETMDDALASIHPKKHAEWKKITNR